MTHMVAQPQLNQNVMSEKKGIFKTLMEKIFGKTNALMSNNPMMTTGGGKRKSKKSKRNNKSKKMKTKRRR